MESYRTLVAWKAAHQLSLVALKGIDDEYTVRAGALLYQLRKAVISVEANIVEGYALHTDPYFAKHIRIAIGSAAETEILALNARDLGYLSHALVERMLALLEQVFKTLRGLLKKYAS
jgi:four helix bundle protein